MKSCNESFNEFCDQNFLVNYITTPTRGRNILDLVLTNNHLLIHYYKTIVNRKLSDHCLLYISLNFSFNDDVKNEKVKNPYLTKIFEYETKNATQIQWGRFEYVLYNIDEEALLKDVDLEEQAKRILKILEETVERASRMRKYLKIQASLMVRKQKEISFQRE